jgi:hypothetical protein
MTRGKPSIKEHFLQDLLDHLWAGYRLKMEYVETYETILAEHGGRFRNDHVAFRTLAAQSPAVGIATLGRFFETLGYRASMGYEFPDTHLNALHFEPPDPRFPKIFVSQLKTWELSPESRRLCALSLREHRPLWSDADLAALSTLDTQGGRRRKELLRQAVSHIQELPWPLPQKKDVLSLNEESQYGAWVLVNGYGVNHFTAAVDLDGVKSLNDIEKVAMALRRAGVPMKNTIEGARGSRLRQTSTEAVVIPTAVREGKKKSLMPWTYAYMEIAERPTFKNPATGRRERYEGFLGPQAAPLFDMTKFVDKRR